MSYRLFSYAWALLFISAMCVFSDVSFAYADGPMVSTFTTNPSTIHHGYTSLLSWTGTGTGYSLVFSCPSGVTALSFDGSTSPCTASRSIPAGVSVLGYTFSNTSTTTQSLKATLIPKDARGIESPAGKADAVLSIGPAPFAPVVPAPPATTTSVTVSTSTPVATTTSLLATSTTRTFFTRTLARGSRNQEVSTLQTLLASLPGIYPDNMITGYFGVLTEKAVQRFQEKYDIAHSGDDGFGIVGPKTRLKLNALREQ